MSGVSETASTSNDPVPVHPSVFPEAFSALRHRNYRIFFGSQVLSLPGTWLQLVAEGWLVYHLTGSALALGVIRFLHTIPVTLLSVVGGGMADRCDKRRMLVITQCFAMLMALTLFVLTVTDVVEVWHVGVLAVGMGMVNAFDIPTRQSFIVELVGKRDLMNAIALNSSVFNASRIVGPAVAGLVISGVGVGYCFLLNAISFLFIIIGYRSLRLPKHRTPSVERPADRGIAVALRLVWETPSLRLLMGTAAMASVFGMSYSTLMPVFAEDVWHVGPKGLGALLASNGIGALMGSATLAYLSHSGRRDLILKIGVTGFSSGLIFFALCPNVYLAMLALIVSGWFMILFFATINTLVQGQVKDEFRGRIMGLYTFCFIGLSPFGAFLSGAIAKGVGAPTAVVFGSSVCLLVSAFLWRASIRVPAS